MVKLSTGVYAWRCVKRLRKRKSVVTEVILLNLTFTPSQPNSYAFINGIEVLSMPSNLYYTSANDNGLKLVGTDT